MKRRPKRAVPEENPAGDGDAILQVKVWLTGISPMVWRRVLVSATPGLANDNSADAAQAA